MADSQYPLQSPPPNDKVTVAATPSGQTVVAKDESSPPKSIFLVSYPKIVFLYPTLIVALVAGVYMLFRHNDVAREDTRVVGLIFLMTLGVNLVVLAFDFPRTTSLTVFFALAALGIGLWFMFYTKPEWLPIVGHIFSRLRPFANASFYFTFSMFLILIYLAVFLSVQFDYWEVRPNELLHHHGVLSDLERFSAPNLRIDKEINDVFEYWLLGSGRLILHPSNERRAVVLENVFSINRKEEQITKMLGALQVQMRVDSDH